MSRHFSVETWSDYATKGGLRIIHMDFRWPRHNAAVPWVEFSVALLGFAVEVTYWPKGRALQ